MTQFKGKRKTFELGKIDFNSCGKRINAVTVEIELTERGGEPTFLKDGTPTGNVTPQYTEFSARGYVRNAPRTDCLIGGQCLDELAEFPQIKYNPVFHKIYQFWKQYHLNGAHVGTPEQEKAIQGWQDAGNKYDYTAACEYLKFIGLYEVEFTGKTVGKVYNHEPYKYGHGWVIQDIPEVDLMQIEALFE